MTAQELFDTKEVLTSEERDLIIAFNPQLGSYLFHNFWNNTWLNLNVYSEVSKEKHDLQREMGF